MSQREAARHFSISPDSVAKMMALAVPPGYRRKPAVKRPKLDALTGIIDGWLQGDREVHHKQRHTARRVFERLQAEHGFPGCYTIVKGYTRERERRPRPRSHGTLLRGAQNRVRATSSAPKSLAPFVCTGDCNL